MVGLSHKILSQGEETADRLFRRHQRGVGEDDAAGAIGEEREQQVLLPDIPVAITGTVGHGDRFGAGVVFLHLRNSHFGEDASDRVGDEIGDDVVFRLQSLLSLVVLPAGGADEKQGVRHAL